MGDINFWLFIDSIINISLFGFALHYSSNIYFLLAGFISYSWKKRFSQSIVNLFSAVSFGLYIKTGGVVSYKFAVSIADYVLKTTAYSDPLTEPTVVAVLGLWIFKQLSAVIESFLSDITSKIFLFVYNDIY